MIKTNILYKNLNSIQSKFEIFKKAVSTDVKTEKSTKPKSSTKSVNLYI